MLEVRCAKAAPIEVEILFAASVFLRSNYNVPQKDWNG